MTSIAPILDDVRSVTRRLAPVLAHWRQAAEAYPGREKAEGEEGKAAKEAFTLPLNFPTVGMLEIDAVLAKCKGGFPDVATETRRKIARRLNGVALQMLAVDAEVMRSLSDLSFTAATDRILLAENDCFDVSCYSVLVAAALSNLGHITLAVGKERKPPSEETWKRYVAAPLLAAARRAPDLRVGDLWFSDLAARTARVWISNLGKLGRHRVMSASLASLASVSVVNKLAEVRRLGLETAKRVNYGEWPELAVLVLADDAWSLRVMLARELAAEALEDPRGLAASALFALLRHVNSIEEPRPALGARLFVALTLAELFERNEKVLTLLLAEKARARHLQTAVQLIERDGSQAATDQDDPLVMDLRDAAMVLRSFRSYANYVSQLPKLKTDPSEDERRSGKND